MGQGKGAGAIREILARWARLFAGTFVFLKKGHYPRTRALILYQ
jgi:hypothetical protein